MCHARGHAFKNQKKEFFWHWYCGKTNGMWFRVVCIILLSTTICVIAVGKIFYGCASWVHNILAHVSCRTTWLTSLNEYFKKNGRHKGKEQQRNRATEEKRNREIGEQRNRGTEERRNRGTKKQRNRGTEGQMNRGTAEPKNRATVGEKTWRQKKTKIKSFELLSSSGESYFLSVYLLACLQLGRPLCFFVCFFTKRGIGIVSG